MEHHIIYKITNMLNNKIYIGKHTTADINDKYMGSGTYIKKAYKKYGKKNFKKEILEETTKELLNDRERYWIKYYKFNKSKYGYNRIIGGDGLGFGKDNTLYGTHPSDEVKEKCRIGNIGKHKGNKSSLAKTYKIIKPNGEVEIITGLNDYCSENNLPFFSALYLLKHKLKGIKGPLKDYRILNIDDNEEIKNKHDFCYKIKEPDGNIVYFYRLTDYAKLHNLNRDVLLFMSSKNIIRTKGKYVGYIIEKINSNNISENDIN